MANSEKILDGLKKLIDKRAVLDKQIAEAEKKLFAEAKNAGKIAKAGAPKKPAGKPRAKKQTTPKL
jgi:hypothetical protein